MNLSERLQQQGGSLQLASFRLGSEWFALEVGTVREVMQPQATSPVPLAPSRVIGLMNVRGVIVTCLSLRDRLGFSGGYGEYFHDLIAEDPESGQPVCLRVDEIGDVLTIDQQQVVARPGTLPERIRSVLLGVCALDGKLLCVLDPQRLLQAA